VRGGEFRDQFAESPFVLAGIDRGAIRERRAQVAAGQFAVGVVVRGARDFGQHVGERPLAL
jgi:hypothetical protein